jgi:hypothetical protein
MISNTHLLRMTCWHATAAIYGHSMPCAPTFSAISTKFRGALVPTVVGYQGIHVPIFRGGPPAYKE